MSKPYALTEEQVGVMRKTLEHIVGNTDEWDQRTWARVSTESSCGTAYCFAGHASVTVGGAASVTVGNPLVIIEPGDDYQIHVADHAQELLGLHPHQASILFRATNSLRRLAELCYLFSDGRVDLLHALPAPTEVDRRREVEQSRESYRDGLPWIP